MLNHNSINTKLTGLASHLVYDGLLEYTIAEQAHQQAQQQNKHFVSYIVENKLINSETIVESCVKAFGLKSFNLSDFNAAWLNNLLIDATLLKRLHVIPLYKQNDILHLGISDPTDRSILDTITFHTGSRAQVMIVAEDKLNQLLNKYVNQTSINHSIQLNLMNQIAIEDKQLYIHENNVNYEEPLVQFVDNILKHAIQQSASDIHIEPYEHNCRIRYRQDGLLRETAEIPTQLALRIITRLKVLAKLDISERRLPQDGRFQFQQHDIRINICPTLFGEKIVLRLLNSSHLIHKISNLGLADSQLNLFLETISQPQGLILVTGPTGSGKTVTLYSALDYLNSEEKNISTVEDPIEIQLHGINQVNIHPKIGLQFSTVLRTLLRQDPDIIMIGEIRDLETAEIAIQAAQTGHLVFSTLHTNSAADAINRLNAMGIAEYNIKNSLSLIIAQRLIRKLCSYCKQPKSYSEETLNTMGFSGPYTSLHFYQAVGCQHCLQGYHGRTGIYELLPILKNQTHLPEFISLKQSGFNKALQGITSIMEINRVIQK
jgi:type IV pilus assembly protein PilB